MNYTENELKNAKYLIRKIGFTNEEKILQLLIHYENEYSYIESTQSTKGIKNRKGQISKYINIYKKEIKNDRCLSMLKWEVELRKNVSELELKEFNEKQYISATDLAAFIFCPASYSISKSFFVEHTLNKLKIDTGSELHEELNLIYKKKYFGFKEDYVSYLNDKQKSILNKIKSCKLIFKGHDDEDKFFKNHERKFIGQPDYIFLDPNNNYFVVEEKYHFQKSNMLIKYSGDSKYKNTDFFPNNLTQLQSYIECINEYDIKYGILINWYYHFDDDKIIIHDFTYKILKKGVNTELFEKTILDIINFKNSKTIEFNNDVNINKCANCSVNLYCSHKTDNLDKLQIPYNKHDLKLKYVEYEY